MKDFFGQELAIGDYVAFEQPKYRNLVLGVVAGFTKEQVRLYWTDPRYSVRSNNYIAADGTKWQQEFRTYPQTLVKRPSITRPINPPDDGFRSAIGDRSSL